MRPSTRQRFSHDVFVSYSHRDRDWVRGWLVPQLKEAGLKVFIDHESFEPGAPSITEMERAVLRSRQTVLVLTPEYLRSQWAEFENILVQTLDPAARQRRLVPLILVSCDPPPRIGMLNYVDFTRSEEHQGRVEQLIAALRHRSTARRARRTGAEPGAVLLFDVPTGALSPESPVYIERRHDRAMRQQVAREGSTTIIEGARQMGKSSLVVRALAHARQQQRAVVDIDFQDLSESYLDDLESLLRYLADVLCQRLNLDVSADETWSGPLGPKDKLTSFVQDHVLRGARMPVVLAIDEVDRVFGRPYQDDFFSLLRAWHNRRARDPLWNKLNLVLAYSTDPRQAIEDLQQSPFNVGASISLSDFSADEVWELNRRYGRPLKRKAQLHSLVEVIGGHPYLAQRAFYALASRTHELEDLLATRNVDAGPFGDLLRHYQRVFEGEPGLRQTMRQVITSGHCADSGLFLRLRSLGLVIGDNHHEARPRCSLYTTYFSRMLS